MGRWWVIERGKGDRDNIGGKDSSQFWMTGGGQVLPRADQNLAR